jgi:hypothetical protein
MIMKDVRAWRMVAIAGALGTLGLVIGCEGEPPPPLQVAVRASMTSGPQAPAADCNTVEPNYLDIGTITSQRQTCTTVENGGPNLNPKGVVDIKECTIIPKNTDPTNCPAVNGEKKPCCLDGCDVGISVTLRNAGDASGTIQLTGTVFDKASGKPNKVNAVFIRQVPSGGFSSPDCSLSFGTNFDGQTNNVMDVAPGRLWGLVECPRIPYNGSQTNIKACAAKAEILIENCVQKKP